MGVDIETATAIPAGIGELSNRFTDGNPQGGTPPTQLNAKFFNAVADEINYAIYTFLATYGLLPLDPDINSQLSLALTRALRYRRNHESGTTDAFTLQTQDSLSGTPLDWKAWEQTGHKAAAAAGTHTLCAITPPNNSRGYATIRGTAVKVGALATYHSVTVDVSWHKTGGAVVIDHYANNYQDGAGGATWTPVNSSGALAVEVSVPGVLANANIFTHMQMVNVTTA